MSRSKNLNVKPQSKSLEQAWDCLTGTLIPNNLKDMGAHDLITKVLFPLLDSLVTISQQESELTKPNHFQRAKLKNQEIKQLAHKIIDTHIHLLLALDLID